MNLAPPVRVSTRVLLLVVVVVGLCGLIVGGVSAADSESEVIATDISADTEEVLVIFEDPELIGMSSSDAESTLKQQSDSAQAPLDSLAETHDGLSVERNFWITNAALVNVDDEDTLEAIAELEGVEKITPNAAIEPAAASAATPSATPTPTEATSSETTYGLEQLDVTSAWADFDTQGEGVRVAVLDSGVDPEHPDIDLYSADSSDSTYPGGWAEFDFYGNKIADSEPYDVNGHGTHVSGTVAGGDASDQHIGVAPEVELVHGSVLGPNGQTVAAGLAGMEWATENDADIISMSLSADEDGEEFIDPVRNAKQQGTVVVAAAGNDGQGTSESPGNISESIAVGATDEFESVASFSSGETIHTQSQWDDPPDDWPSEYVVPDVAAPGVGVYSSVPGGWGTTSGTSMATPHVAGVAALMQSASDETLTPAEVEDALVDSAWKPDGEPSEQDDRYGHGIVNAHAAVDAVAEKTEDDSDANDDGDKTDATPERSVSDTAVAPGETVDVTVEVPYTGDGIEVIQDAFDPSFESVYDAESTSGAIDASTEEVSTLFPFDPAQENVTMTYSVEIPADAEDGDEFVIDGEVVYENSDANIEADTITVTEEESVDRDDDVERTLSQTEVGAGETVDVTIAVTYTGEGIDIIEENFHPEFADVTDAEASGGAAVETAADEVLALYLSPETDDATLEYTVEIPDDADGGDEFDISGNIVFEDSEANSGVDTIVITEGYLDSIANDDGVVDTDGLRAAIADWRDGSIDTDMLREAIGAWRSGDPVTN